MSIFAQTEELALFNAGEAVWWFLTAAFVAIYWRHWRGLTPRLRDALVVFLIAFGISDLIEIRTGAWWMPVSLLVFKGVCLIGLIGCGAILLWRRRRHAPQDRREED